MTTAAIVNTTEDSNLDYFQKNVKEVQAVDLEDLEIAALAKEAAKEDEKLAELKTKFGDEKKEWQDKINLQERKVEKIREDIARGKQDRVVLCDEIFRNGTILTFVRESGRVIRQRPATPSEAQKHLPAVEGSSGILAQAARAQKEANVEVTDEGDVVPPDGSDAPKKNGKKK